MKLPVFSILFLSLATGCISENKFAERFAEAYCDKMEECAGDAFDSVFPNCVETMKSGVEATVDACEDYKGGLAYKCVKEIKDMSCTESDPAALESCEEFDNKCGNDGQAPIAGGNGEPTIYGLADVDWSTAE